MPHHRLGPLVRTVAPVDADSLPPVDCVLLSHLHADHADPPSLRRVGPATPIVAPRGAAEWLRHAELADVVELRAGEETWVGPVRVLATEARHNHGRRPGGPVGEPVGYSWPDRGRRSSPELPTCTRAWLTCTAASMPRCFPCGAGADASGKAVSLRSVPPRRPG